MDKHVDLWSFDRHYAINNTRIFYDRFQKINLYLCAGLESYSNSIFSIFNCFIMRIDILSVVPELLESPLNHSIIKRAKEKGIVEIHIHNIRDWSKDKHRKVDDYSFGGDAGLVMAVQPIFDCINELTSQRHYDEIIYTAPDAPVFTQKTANELSLKENIMILCGHYKGVDHRVREHLITREISVGDYVLTGGELPACIMTDAIVRLLPGAMGDETSALTDSFQDNLLAPPVYTLSLIHI